MGGRHAKLVEALKVPRNAEAWDQELRSLLSNGNLVIIDITEVPSGYKPIGYAAAFKDKYNPITKQYASTRARFAPHGFRQIAGRDFDIEGEREEDVVYYDTELAKAIDTRGEDPHIILGVVLVETAHSVQLNMRFQIEAVLERYGMLDANVKQTPLPASLVLRASTDLQTAESKQYPYAEVVGSVMWIIRCTFVSAKYACNTLCAHMTKWDSTHVAAAQNMPQAYEK